MSLMLFQETLIVRVVRLDIINQMVLSLVVFDAIIRTQRFQSNHPKNLNVPPFVYV